MTQDVDTLWSALWRPQLDRVRPTATGVCVRAVGCTRSTSEPPRAVYPRAKGDFPNQLSCPSEEGVPASLRPRLRTASGANRRVGGILPLTANQCQPQRIRKAVSPS